MRLLLNPDWKKAGMLGGGSVYHKGNEFKIAVLPQGILV